MRILWVTNIPFGGLSELAGLSVNTSGSWLNASLDAFIGDRNYEIIVVTSGNTAEIKTSTQDNITYCLIPGGNVAHYDHKSSYNRKVWETINNTYRPDVIQIWGTEKSHGHLALKVMNNIPAVIYMQGLKNQIARYYLSGMSDAELRSSLTLRDILKREWIKQAQRIICRRSLIEAEMIKMAGNVIVENDWCDWQCKAIDPHCVAFKSKLSIKDDFYNESWSLDKMNPYTILGNTARAPIKGLHILLKALAQVACDYPQVKLLVPGEDSPFEKNWLQRMRLPGYSKYIHDLVLKLNLKQNVEFLGRLSSKQMAQRMAESNLFVMPSSIENHSSTLIEAMIVGTPCISSYVGGVPEYLQHNTNGLLYRFEEYEILAAYIKKMFADPQYAAVMGSTAREQMRNSRQTADFKNDLVHVYNTLAKTRHN